MPIQIIPAAQRKPNTAQKLNMGMESPMKFSEQIMQQQQAQQKRQQEDQWAKNNIGIDIAGIQDPKLRQAYVEKALQGQLQEQKYGFEQQLTGSKNQGDIAIEERDYNTIKDTFGQKFADVWRASPVGGRTDLEKFAIDAYARGENIENILEGMNVSKQSMKPEETIIPQKLPQMKNGKISSEFKWPDYTKRPQGYTAKEWTDTRKEWRKENVPIFEANNTKLDSTNADIFATKKLKTLSDKLPEGIERIIINPESGELYGIAQLAGLASPEIQEWVKTIARFQNRAKDTFGSRVTNFDLVSYMKQFPGLLNTKEGRNRIIRMMEINYDLDKLYEQALKNVYQHYGLNNIPQEEADRLAREMVEDETDRLKTEYLGNDAQVEQMQQKKKGLSDEIVDKYLDLSGNDPVKAMKMAKEDGYDVPE
jgi:hypothetical protein